ncbi:MAG: acyl carrier protein [Sphingorhabdus sp.]
MTEQEIRALIIEEIGNIAPETDATNVPLNADLREALDLDSMDLFNLVVALSERLELDIPEVDVPMLTTLAGATAYLVKHVQR